MGRRRVVPWRPGIINSSSSIINIIQSVVRGAVPTATATFLSPHPTPRLWIPPDHDMTIMTCAAQLGGAY